jgi:hypothetical protein
VLVTLPVYLAILAVPVLVMLPVLAVLPVPVMPNVLLARLAALIPSPMAPALTQASSAPPSAVEALHIAWSPHPA